MNTIWSFCFFPLAALGAALHCRRIHWSWVIPGSLVYTVLATPLHKMTQFRQEYSEFGIWIQEGKFISMLLLLAMTIYIAIRSPIVGDSNRSTQGGCGQEDQTDPEQVGQQ